MQANKFIICVKILTTKSCSFYILFFILRLGKSKHKNTVIEVFHFISSQLNSIDRFRWAYLSSDAKAISILLFRFTFSFVMVVEITNTNDAIEV